MAKEDFTGVPTVEPGKPSGQLLDIKSTPQEFGANIGEAEQKLGSTVEQGAKTAGDLAYEVQGQINQNWAEHGEVDFAIKSSAIADEVKGLKGYAAVNAAQDAQQKIRDLQTQYAATAPTNGAQRAFMTLTGRHVVNQVTDIGTYATSQFKQADTDAATATIQFARDQSTRPEVANNDDRFQNDVAGVIKANAPRVVANQGWGTYDKRTGQITFDDTPEGQQGKQVYDAYVAKNVSDAVGLRIETVADDLQNGGIDKAAQIYNKAVADGDLVGQSAHEVAAFLRPRQSEAVARTASVGALAPYQSPSAPPSVPQPGAAIPDTTTALPPAIHTANVPAEAESVIQDAAAKNGVDGAKLIRVAQIEAPQPGEKQSPNAASQGLFQLNTGDAGISAQDRFDNAKAADAAAKFWKQEGTTLQSSLGRAPTDAENYLAYQQNAPEAAALIKNPNQNAIAAITPFYHGNTKLATEAIVNNGGSVNMTAGQFTSMISGKWNRASVPSDQKFTSTADRMIENEPQILQNAYEAAFKSSNGDEAIAQRAREMAEIQISQARTVQNNQITADRHTLDEALKTPLKNGLLPTERGQLPPEAQASFDNLAKRDPYSVTGANAIFASNAHGQAAGYGTDFYGLLHRAVSGELKPEDLDRYVVGGEDGPLTNTGLTLMKAMLKDPRASSFAGYIDGIHRMLSGQSGNQVDPKGEEKFEKWLRAAVPAMLAEKDTAKITDPKGPIYSMARDLQRPYAQVQMDMADANMDNPVSPAGTNAATQPQGGGIISGVGHAIAAGYGALTTPSPSPGVPPSMPVPPKFANAPDRTTAPYRGWYWAKVGNQMVPVQKIQGGQ